MSLQIEHVSVYYCMCLQVRIVLPAWFIWEATEEAEEHAGQMKIPPHRADVINNITGSGFFELQFDLANSYVDSRLQ